MPTIDEIAQEFGLDPKPVLGWAADLSLSPTGAKNTLTDAEGEKLRSHIASVIGTVWTSSCCEGLVAAVRDIKELLAGREQLDFTGEQRFLGLRAALGPRRTYDPVTPVGTKNSTATSAPIPGATARWCDGELIGISWAGRKSDAAVNVVIVQGGKEVEALPLKAGETRLTTSKPSKSDPIDRLEIKGSDGKTLAVAGLLPALPVKC